MPHEVSESSTDAMRAFKEACSCLETEEGREKGLCFLPREDDLFIVTPPKCGTTWIQQIVHSLRSDGDMNFDEISLVIPYIEMAHDYGYTDLNKSQGYLPRAYKTHAWYSHCPKGAGKYIYAIRNPQDVAVSFYNFFNGWFFPKDAISIDDFTLEFLARRGLPQSIMQNASYWHNLTSWFPHRGDENVLWIHYEDLIEDLPACVELISNFLEIGANDDELKAKTVHQASLDFMKANGSKYDEHHLKLWRNEACGLPKDAGLSSTKVRGGGSGPKPQPSPAIKCILDEKWESIVFSATGYACYEDLRAGINKELGRSFDARKEG